MSDYDELVAASSADAIRATLTANADELSEAASAHHMQGMGMVREAEYKGRHIEVKTTYEITVDGKPFDVHLVVNNQGRVYYHGLPTRDFPSAVDLVKKAIDVFGDEVGGNGNGNAGHEGHEHEHGHGGMHMGGNE